MKRIVTIALSVILFGLAQTALAQFTLKTDKDTIKIYPGETAVFSIGFDIQNGYDASILLSLVPGSPLIQNGGGSLSTHFVNTPYDAVKLTVKTTAIFTQSGVYQFRVEGKNTGISSSVVCYVEVVASPKTNWRIKTASKPMGGIPAFIVQDSENNYWYQVRNKHLHKVSNGILLDEWIGDDTTIYGYAGISPIIDYKSHKLWMASDGGIWNIDLVTKYITVKEFQFVQSMVLDTNTGTLWFGGRLGLASYSKGMWTIYDTTNSILRGPVLGLGLHGSTVWLGSIGALIKYDGTTWTEYTSQNSGMPASGPKVMAVEPNGDVWAALSEYWDLELKPYSSMVGLGKFDGTTWTLYNYQNSPLHKTNIVNSVAIDKKGNKWIATATHDVDPNYGYMGGAGILKFDNKEWTAFTKDNSPLPDNKINWLAVDNDDNIWFHQYLEGIPNTISFWGVFNENGLPFPMAPTSVEEQPIDIPDTDGGLFLSPNPVSTSLSVSGIEGVAAISIVNSLGMEVMQCSMENMGSTIDLSGLPNGVYFVQFRTATGMITRPIVVSH